MLLNLYYKGYVMRQIFLLLLFSTMLFSAQKQIILGCFLQEKFAQQELEKLKKYLENDKYLIKVTEVNSLRAELTKSEGFSVLRLASFEDNNQLFLTLHLLKKYYRDSYVLDFSLSEEITQKEFVKVKEVVTVAEKEMPVMEEKIENIEVKEVPLQEEKVEVIKEVKPSTILSTPKKIKEPVVAPSLTKKIVEEETYYVEYLLGLLALLAASGVGFLFHKMNTKAKTDDSDK